MVVKNEDIDFIVITFILISEYYKEFGNVVLITWGFYSIKTCYISDEAGFNPLKQIKFPINYFIIIIIVSWTFHT